MSGKQRTRRRRVERVRLAAVALGAAACFSAAEAQTPSVRDVCLTSLLSASMHSPSLCGTSFAQASASLVSFLACMQSGGTKSGHVGEEWMLALAQSYGGLSEPCSGGSSAGNVLAPLASIHTKLGAAQTATPFLAGPACRPQTLTSCAFPSGRVDGQLFSAPYRRLLRQPVAAWLPSSLSRLLGVTSDSSFESCPALQDVTRCSDADGNAVAPSWSTPDAGGASSLDQGTVNVSRPLSTVDLSFVSTAQTLGLRSGVNNAQQPQWGPADVAEVTRYFSADPTTAAPILVTVSYCRALEAWLAGCTAAPGLLYFDSSRGLCVYRTKATGPAAGGIAFFSPTLGLYVSKAQPTAIARSSAYNGPNCAASGPRTTMMILGVDSGTNSTITMSDGSVFTSPNWILADPTSGQSFLINPLLQGGLPSSSNGGLSMSGPHSLALGPPRSGTNMPSQSTPLAPLTSSILTSAGVSTVAPSRMINSTFPLPLPSTFNNFLPSSLAESSIANAWAPVTNSTDPYLFEALVFAASRAVQMLRGNNLVLEALEKVQCRLVGTSMMVGTVAAARVCQMEVWVRDPSATDEEGEFSADLLTMAHSLYASSPSSSSGFSLSSLAARPLPAFLTKTAGNAQALSTVAVLAYKPAFVTGQPNARVIPPEIPAGMSPFTREEVNGIQWSLVFYACIVGVVVVAGAFEYCRRTSLSASRGYSPVTVMPGAAVGGAGGYGGYPAHDPYAYAGSAMPSASSSYRPTPPTSSMAAAWRGADPLDFDRIPDPKQFQVKRAPRVTDW